MISYLHGWKTVTSFGNLFDLGWTITYDINLISFCHDTRWASYEKRYPTWSSTKGQETETFGGDHKDNVGVPSAMAAISSGISLCFHGCKDPMWRYFCKFFDFISQKRKILSKKKRNASISNIFFYKWTKSPKNYYHEWILGWLWIQAVSWNIHIPTTRNATKGHFTHKTESPWSLHFKHSYWWKRRGRSKFASHYAQGTNGVYECKMDVQSTWVRTWHWMDHVLWSLGLFPKTTTWR